MSNLTTVTRIGAGVRLTESAAAAIAATAPEGFDAAARGAVAALVIAWAVPEGVEVPAQRVGAKGAQKSTDFGRGVDALTKAVKRLLSDAPTESVLRATLSGEGGGSVTIPADHALYAALVAMIREGQES